MSKPNVVCIDDEEYYLADELKEFDKRYFHGCAKTSRKIIEKKSISENKYDYIIQKEGNWKFSNESSKKAKLAIKKKWIEKNMPSMSNGKVKEEYDNEPNQIVLKNNESLIDEDASEMDIMIVGEREYNKCYFRVKDISKYFEAPNLDNAILRNDRDSYVENKHYKYFISNKNAIGKKHLNTKILYLTYAGLIRFLFTSRNKKAELFQEWATKILFTHQVGTLEQRTKLVKNLLGTTVTNAIDTLNNSVSEISCVYLLVIGKVKDIKQLMKIKNDWDDECYVCKFGETCDLRRRINEHKTTYGEFGNDLRLKYYGYVDGINTIKAENAIKKRFIEMNVVCQIEKHDEIIILNKEQLKTVRIIYKEQEVIFGADIKEYKRNTEKNISELEHKVGIAEEQLKSKDKELQSKDKELQSKDKELQSKDKEISFVIEKCDYKDEKINELQDKIKHLKHKLKRNK